MQSPIIYILSFYFVILSVHVYNILYTLYYIYINIYIYIYTHSIYTIYIVYTHNRAFIFSLLVISFETPCLFTLKYFGVHSLEQKYSLTEQ